MAVSVNWVYAETAAKELKPKGKGWEYWGDRVTPGENVAVWRRDADIYGHPDEEGV